MATAGDCYYLGSGLGRAARPSPPPTPRRLARSPTEVTNCESPRACLSSGFFFGVRAVHLLVEGMTPPPALLRSVAVLGALSVISRWGSIVHRKTNGVGCGLRKILPRC